MKPQFITDEKGNRTGVILSIDDFERLTSLLPERNQTNWKKRLPLRNKQIHYEGPFESPDQWEANGQ